MKLTLAANYDLELVPKLAQYPVSEVYGKLPGDFVGGGRPSYMGTPVSNRDIEDYVALLHKHGIAFNYLLNSSCQGNREWTRRWQRRLTRMLERLGNMGIRHLTVSTPYLLEAIKSRFPDFKIKVGIYAQVDTPRRAKFWEELGADAINLESFSINRDFPRLEAIREAVQCDLQLIANHSCLPNCAMQNYHQNGYAHASDGSRTLYIDYCFFRCSQIRLEDPTNFIKAAWIRPEDLRVYEEMGYETFKLIERGMPSDELLKRVKAYSERRFDGNLAELLLSYGFKKPVKKARFWTVRNFLKPFQINPLKLLPLLKMARSQGMLFPVDELPVVIDNAQLPADFIDGFRKRDCASLDCAACGYCEEISRRAVRVKEEFRNASLEQLRQTHDQMTTGKLWGAQCGDQPFGDCSIET